jgi:hypothetical protein
VSDKPKVEIAPCPMSGCGSQCVIVPLRVMNTIVAHRMVCTKCSYRCDEYETVAECIAAHNALCADVRRGREAAKIQALQAKGGGPSRNHKDNLESYIEELRAEQSNLWYLKERDEKVIAPFVTWAVSYFESKPGSGACPDPRGDHFFKCIKSELLERDRELVASVNAFLRERSEAAKIEQERDALRAEVERLRDENNRMEAALDCLGYDVAADGMSPLSSFDRDEIIRTTLDMIARGRAAFDAALAKVPSAEPDQAAALDAGQGEVVKP